MIGVHLVRREPDQKGRTLDLCAIDGKIQTVHSILQSGDLFVRVKVVAAAAAAAAGKGQQRLSLCKN